MSAGVDLGITRAIIVMICLAIAVSLLLRLLQRRAYVVCSLLPCYCSCDLLFYSFSAAGSPLHFNTKTGADLMRLPTVAFLIRIN